MSIIPFSAALRGRCVVVPVEVAASHGLLTARCPPLGLEFHGFGGDPLSRLVAAIARRSAACRVRYVAVIPGGRP